MAPEYIRHGQFSVKSDVFSFGVLVLEIVSGQKNSSFQHGEHVEDLISFVSLFFFFNVFTIVFLSIILDECMTNSNEISEVRSMHVSYIFGNCANPCRPGKTGRREQHQIS